MVAVPGQLTCTGTDRTARKPSPRGVCVCVRGCIRAGRHACMHACAHVCVRACAWLAGWFRYMGREHRSRDSQLAAAMTFSSHTLYPSPRSSTRTTSPTACQIQPHRLATPSPARVMQAHVAKGHCTVHTIMPVQEGAVKRIARACCLLTETPLW